MPAQRFPLFAPEIGDRTERLGVKQLVYHGEMMGCDHVLLVSYLDREYYLLLWLQSNVC
jgi:hypothetical protein